MRNRSCALAVLAVVLASPRVARAEGPVTPSGATRPNVVLIVADDLGYGETGAQGGTDIPTPNIDSIAKEGVRFTQGYVSCPVCSPTRAGLLTGRYGERFGFDMNPGPQATASGEFGLPKDQPTLAERLKALGYATGMVGKWHLGYREGLRPTERGFDEFFGFLGGAHPYLPGGRGGAQNPILRGTTPVDAPPYLTDAFGDEASAFVRKHKDEPFFLYMPFNAVHAPLQATQTRIAGVATPATDPKSGAPAPEKRRTFLAMLSAMDEAIGRLFAALRESGVDDRTLVVFLSDNGGPTGQTTSRNGPLRGFKGQVFEGGVRVPFMARWKGTLPAGTTYDAPVISLDVVPTVLAAIGSPAGADAKLDGVNLIPFLTGTATGRPHLALCWRFGAQSAVRVGDWKLVNVPGAEPMLFDLSKDAGEATDLAAQDPKRVVTLQAVWGAWNTSNLEPRWGKGAKGGGRRARGGAGMDGGGMDGAGMDGDGGMGGGGGGDGGPGMDDDD